MDALLKYKMLIKEHIAPYLKKQGLKEETSSIFTMRNEFLRRSLVFEKDRFNYPGRSAFRIFLEITGVVSIRNRNTVVANYINNENHIPILRISLSELAGRKLSAYTVYKYTEIHVLASQVIHDIEEYALSPLRHTETTKTLEKFVNVISRQTGVDRYFFTMAIYFAAEGLTEKSKIYFLRSPGDRDIIRKIAKACNVNLNE